MGDLQSAVGAGRVILRVDRLDSSSRIVRRLEAFERFLERAPRWHRRIALVQVVLPALSGPAVPVHYLYRSTAGSLVLASGGDDLASAGGGAGAES